MTAENLEHDKLLAPHSHDAEEALLGSILINPNTYHETATIVTAADFFVLRNRWIWEAYERLDKRGDAIEYVLVMNELKAREQLDLIGGGSYLGYLITQATTWVYADAYAVVVSRMAQRRNLLEAANEIAQLARAEELDIHEVLQRSEAVFNGATQRQSEQANVSFEQITREHLKLIELRAEGKVTPSFNTPWNAFNAKTEGFDPGDFVIFAARPSVGKTGTLANLFIHYVRQGVRVAYFTLETRFDQLMDRMTAIHSGIPANVISKGKMQTDQEWSLFYKASAEIGESQAFGNGEASSVEKLRMHVKQLVRHHGTQIVILDYFQLLKPSSELKGSYNSTQVATYNSQALKEIANKTGVVLITASQLNREIEKRENGKVRLSDMRESGSLEQDADFVAGLNRDTDSEHSRTLTMSILKDRNHGAYGDVLLDYDRPTQRILDMPQGGQSVKYDDAPSWFDED